MLTTPEARPNECRRTVSQVLRSALWVALCVGTAVGLVLAVVIARENDLALGRDTVVLAGHLVGLYVLVQLVGLVSLAAGLLLVGLRPGPRVFIAATVAFYVLLNGLLRFSLAVQLLSVTPFISAIGAIDATVIMAVTILVAGAILATTPRIMLRRAVAAAALTIALWGFQTWHERPFVRDLAQSVPPLLLSTQPAPRGSAPESFENARLVVLGFDGLSWEILIPLLKRGDLPHFRALLEDAAYGQLETLPFTISPVVWETISTGQSPERHGIGYHQHFQFAGMSERVRILPNFVLCNSPMGIRRLLTYGAGWGPWKGVPVDATDARVARFWEIASRAGRTVGVYNWLNTGPAVPVNGFLHAYGVTPPLDYPPDLQAGMPPIVSVDVPVAEGEAWIQANLPYEQSHYRRFVDLSLRFQPEVLMFYTHVGDGVNHLEWKHDVAGESLFLWGLVHKDYEPGREVTAVNQFLDEILGDVLSRVHPEASIVIVSDHGFGFRGYEHDNGPPGVLIVRGPGVRPGPFTGATVADVTPTMLDILGLAVADDMQGRSLPIAESGGALGRAEGRVASYGPSASRDAQAQESDAEALRRHREYLRALGYVN